MITKEQADQVLHQILNKELLPTSTKWGEIFATMGSETDTIGRGLDALDELIQANTDCVLYGWIDQAALEIVLISRLAELRGRAVNYRADQGGDTGVLAMYDGTAFVLDFSFERGAAALREYKPAEQVAPCNTH